MYYVLLTSDLWLAGTNENINFRISESIVELILLPR